MQWDIAGKPPQYPICIERNHIVRRGVLLFMSGRALQSILVLWVIVTLLFLLFRLAPANPLVAYIDPTFTEEQQEMLMERFGLNKSLPEQYFVYIANLTCLAYNNNVVLSIVAVFPLL